MRILVILVVSIISFSCQSKEQKEVSALLEVIFDSTLERGDSVYLIKEAVINWDGNAKSEVCDLEWMDVFFSNPSLNGFKISTIYTRTEAKKVCQESKQPFIFRSEKLHPMIRLIPKDRIDAMKQTYLERGGGEIEVRNEMDKFRYYETLSKPIFTRNYKYAFIYKQSVCFPDPCQGPALIIYEKANGKWKPVIGKEFYLI